MAVKCEFYWLRQRQNSFGESIEMVKQELIDCIIEGIPDENLKVHANL